MGLQNKGSGFRVHGIRSRVQATRLGIDRLGSMDSGLFVLTA